ncbi:MAG: hypothetical protein QJR07_20890 [Acetobacteraceae bacterium]|nr:hypothetical protein [Acetobacteraceae bacterium]
MSAIPDTFPDALLSALPAGLGQAEAALIAAPGLARFWNTIAQHLPRMVKEGWNPLDAAQALVGAVLIPVMMGYNAHGTIAFRVRKGVNMGRRAKAAKLARELAALLDEIEREPLPPGAAIAVADLLSRRLVARDAPSYLKTERPAAILRRLADALGAPPDYSQAPGLASQKASWRGFIREVQANLADVGFHLRERDAVELAGALCRSAGLMTPSRDAVRDALRWGDLAPDSVEK